MVRSLIERYKNLRKRKYINLKSDKSYAFVGLGNHSIHNLYPVIHYFRLNVKYIVTKSVKNATFIDENFPNSIGTNEIDKVLIDDEIFGIFICTHPSSHYDLVKKALKAGKNVFVEKPPCASREELESLIEEEKKSLGVCMVGFQRQYAPFTNHLKNKLDNASYNYRYITGNYPEGDPIFELFIHPLSLIFFLFGPIKSFNKVERVTKSTITLFLQFVHERGQVGTLELSTDYSWKNAMEKLVINTPKRIYEMSDSETLTYEVKRGSIFNIPLEKIYTRVNALVTLEKRNNFNPIMHNNQLYSNGYFSEIEQFIEICELRRTTNSSSLISCRDVYKIMDQIKNV